MKRKVEVYVGKSKLDKKVLRELRELHEDIRVLREEVAYLRLQMPYTITWTDTSYSPTWTGTTSAGSFYPPDKGQFTVNDEDDNEAGC